MRPSLIKRRRRRRDRYADTPPQCQQFPERVARIPAGGTRISGGRHEGWHRRRATKGSRRQGYRRHDQDCPQARSPSKSSRTCSQTCTFRPVSSQRVFWLRPASPFQERFAADCPVGCNFSRARGSERCRWARPPPILASSRRRSRPCDRMALMPEPSESLVRKTFLVLPPGD